MVKVVLNNCYGGFSLSKDAIEFLERNHAFEDERQKLELSWYKDWASKNPENEKYYVGDFCLRRDNPVLVECVSVLKEKANTRFSELVVEDVDDDFYIGEYDGLERVFYSQQEAEDFSFEGFPELNLF